ncbi:MAG TPA: hypothetical protein ENN46_03700 [Candidatus Woesearchaeota archaeon]|nr:hypothetical protein [Candidatus Woesearchaeota archaeon]
MLSEAFSIAGDILIAPFIHTQMLWDVIPLLVTMVVIEIYFGRYKDESLGWNSALSNSLVLIFVGSSLIRYLHSQGLFDFPDAWSGIAVFLVTAGIYLAVFNFYHEIPRKIAFGLSSVLPINMLAYIGVVMIYRRMHFDLTTILGILFVFAGAWAFFSLLKYVIVKATPDN